MRVVRQHLFDIVKDAQHDPPRARGALLCDVDFTEIRSWIASGDQMMFMSPIV